MSDSHCDGLQLPMPVPAAEAPANYTALHNTAGDSTIFKMIIGKPHLRCRGDVHRHGCTVESKLFFCVAADGNLKTLENMLT